MLARLRAGELSVDEALEEIRRVQLVELAGNARMDIGRTARRGIPEVVLAAGKPPESAARLILALARAQGVGLGSRLGPEHWTALEAGAGDATRRAVARDGITLVARLPTSKLVTASVDGS